MSFITFASVKWSGDNGQEVVDFLSSVTGFGSIGFSGAHGAFIVPRASGIGSLHIPRGWCVTKPIGGEFGPIKATVDDVYVQPPERNE